MYENCKELWIWIVVNVEKYGVKGSGGVKLSIFPKMIKQLHLSNSSNCHVLTQSQYITLYGALNHSLTAANAAIFVLLRIRLQLII